jgi:hypothetical protein
MLTSGSKCRDIDFRRLLADFVDYIEKKFFIKEPYFFGVGGIPVRRGWGSGF